MHTAKPVWQNSDYAITATVRSGDDGIAVLDTRTGQLRYLDWKDGSERWSIEPGVVLGGATLLADSTQLYVLSGGTIEAYRTADGQRAFSKVVMAGDAAESIVGGHLTRQALLLAGRRARLVALSPTDGQVLWQSEPNAAPSPVQGMHLYEESLVSYTYEDLTVHELNTGKLRWRYPFAAGLGATLPRLITSTQLTPAYGGLVLALTGASIVALDIQKGVPRWQQPTQGLAVYTGNTSMLVVADEQKVRGLDPTTGEVRWQQPLAGIKLLAPLSETTALLQQESGPALLEYASGKLTAQGSARIGRDDRVLLAGEGHIALTYGLTIRFFHFEQGQLKQSEATLRAGLGAQSLKENEPIAALRKNDLLLIQSKASVLTLFRD